MIIHSYVHIVYTCTGSYLFMYPLSALGNVARELTDYHYLYSIKRSYTVISVNTNIRIMEREPPVHNDTKSPVAIII